VIASVNGRPAILECLEALTHQQGDVPYEVIVVDCCDEATREEIRRRFPNPEVRLLPVEGRPSIPKLRAIGMAQAKGRMIAILEDHCNVVPTWMQVVERAHREGRQALGGAVDNGAVDRLTDWAVFFCEYARFMPPLPRGEVPEITGNNSVYARSALDRLGTDLQGEVWEAFLHGKMRELGIPFYCDPDLLVSHKKEFGFGYFMSQRYHYSRSFAGMRMERASFARRMVYALATGILPPLLMWRMAKTIWRKGKRRWLFVRTIPVLVPFLVSWAWGEAVGSLFGPGTSLARVE
jgi:glycosyltransferase involved in cell wall biosynthesis